MTKYILQMLMVIRLGATPVSLSLLSLQVYAAASSEKETPKKELLKIEEELYAKAMPKLEKAVEHGREGFELLQNPPAGFYPRLGVIGFSGIVGLFLARGSKIKKLVYPMGLMGLGASMYYPQQAVSIAKVAGTQLYDWSLQGYIAVESLWKDNPKKKKSGKKSDKGDADGDKPLEIHAASNEKQAQK
ncbi:MICOS complex subunit MIC26 isoform X5 [Caloenas nicobarica]|uniref:MICOS complex subunit MIC26 isoform X5 n=1 Tax=Caloenas nicobarica TaxID=187106 RepID=UPI0032B7C475